MGKCLAPNTFDMAAGGAFAVTWVATLARATWRTVLAMGERLGADLNLADKSHKACVACCVQAACPSTLPSKCARAGTTRISVVWVNVT